jgi:hypothetical protein
MEQIQIFEEGRKFFFFFEEERVQWFIDFFFFLSFFGKGRKLSLKKSEKMEREGTSLFGVNGFNFGLDLETAFSLPFSSYKSSFLISSSPQ